jgi:hypothetical protein
MVIASTEIHTTYSEWAILIIKFEPVVVSIAAGVLYLIALKDDKD